MSVYWSEPVCYLSLGEPIPELRLISEPEQTSSQDELSIEPARAKHENRTEPSWAESSRIQSQADLG